MTPSVLQDAQDVCKLIDVAYGGLATGTYGYDLPPGFVLQGRIRQLVQVLNYDDPYDDWGFLCYRVSDRKQFMAVRGTKVPPVSRMSEWRTDADIAPVEMYGGHITRGDYMLYKALDFPIITSSAPLIIGAHSLGGPLAGQWHMDNGGWLFTFNSPHWCDAAVAAKVEGYEFFTETDVVHCLPVWPWVSAGTPVKMPCMALPVEAHSLAACVVGIGKLNT